MKNSSKYDLPYFLELMAIEDTLSIHYRQNSNFEKYITNKCQRATRLTNIILPHLKEQAGNCTNEWHAWNIDQERQIIIDLTAWQFHDLKISSSQITFPINHYEFRFNKRKLQQHKQFFINNKNNINSEINSLLETYQNIRSGY